MNPGNQSAISENYFRYAMPLGSTDFAMAIAKLSQEEQSKIFSELNLRPRNLPVEGHCLIVWAKYYYQQETLCNPDFEEALSKWARSTEGTNVRSALLKLLRETQNSDEIMLCFIALVTLQYVENGFLFPISGHHQAVGEMDKLLRDGLSGAECYECTLHHHFQVFMSFVPTLRCQYQEHFAVFLTFTLFRNQPTRRYWRSRLSAGYNHDQMMESLFGIAGN